MKDQYSVFSKSMCSVLIKLSKTKRPIIYTAISIFFSLSLICGESHAISFLESNAIVEWNTLSISFDTGININYTSEGSLSWAAVQDSSAYDQDFAVIDSFGDISATANVPDATSHAWTSSSSTGITTQLWDIGAEAHGGARRNAEFIISGSGNIYISIDYYLDQTINAESGAFAEGFIGAFLGLYNDTTGTSDRDEDVLVNYAYSGSSLSDSSSGTFSVTLNFNDKDNGSFQTVVDTHSHIVPEPSSVFLFLGGIGCLAGLRKRNEKTRGIFKTKDHITR